MDGLILFFTVIYTHNYGKSILTVQCMASNTSGIIVDPVLAYLNMRTYCMYGYSLRLICQYMPMYGDSTV
jgi:hypothetical protein